MGIKMTTYEKWNEDNTKLRSIITNPDSVKLAKMAGYLLVVEPVIDQAIEKNGDKTFSATERSWEVITKAQEEQDAHTAEQEEIAQAASDKVEIQEEIAQSPLSGITFDQVDTWVDSNITDLGSAKVAITKLAKAILILNKRLGL